MLWLESDPPVLANIGKDSTFYTHRGNNKIHCKKRFEGFPSPAGMSLTKPSLAGNHLIIPVLGEFGKWHPGCERKTANIFFYSLEGRETPIIKHVLADGGRERWSRFQRQEKSIVQYSVLFLFHGRYIAVPRFLHAKDPLSHYVLYIPSHDSHGVIQLCICWNVNNLYLQHCEVKQNKN